MDRSATYEELLREEHLFSTFFKCVGLGILDEQLRYQALNAKLAWMNGAPIESHLGKTLREMLGREVAAQAEPAFAKVFASGEPILNLEVGGMLPTKQFRGIVNLFPSRDENGRVKQVGGVVLELPIGVSLETTKSTSFPDASPVLRSWKEIAYYLGTCVRTVQRWEGVYDFPVRRLQRTKGAAVFAMRTEIDSWMDVKSRSASMTNLLS